jgi:hypothetical protein
MGNHLCIVRDEHTAARSCNSINLLLVNVTARANVIDVDDIILFVVPVNYPQFSDANSLITCSVPGHVYHTRVGSGVLRQVRKALAHPFPIWVGQPLQIAKSAPMDNNFAH